MFINIEREYPFSIMSEHESKSQQTMTLTNKLLDIVYNLKKAGETVSISDFFERAGWAFLEKTKPVTRTSVVAYVVFPWTVSILLWAWSQHARDLAYSFFIFYGNIASFGIAVAGVYWLYLKYKDK